MPLGEIIEHRDLLGDAQRIVPRQDHRRRAEIAMARHRRQILINCKFSGQNE